MLPSELLMQRYHGDEIIPLHLPLTQANLTMAADLIDLFKAVTGQTRGELATQLQVLEGEATDYRIKRGLAHLLSTGLVPAVYG